MASSLFKHSAVIKLATYIKETRDGKISFNKNLRQRQRSSVVASDNGVPHTVIAHCYTVTQLVLNLCSNAIH
jgi:hypothetical protein